MNSSPVRKRILLIVSIILLSSLANAQTKMPAVLKESRISNQCKQVVNQLANRLIGPKKHHILKNSSTEQNFFDAFLLLSYNDQESHINITARDTSAGCDVSYTESFSIKISCIEARESLFKRWQLLGKLSATTRVMRYDFPRDKSQLPKKIADRATAYLTATDSGKSCLVTKKQHHIHFIPQ